MTRTLCVLACVALSACGDSPGTGDSPASMAAERSPARVHAETLTLDSHVDIPFAFATDAHDPLDAEAQVNLGSMRGGGLDAAFFIVYVGQTERTPDNYDQAQADAMTKFDAIHRMTVEMYPDRIELAYTADDVARIESEGNLVAAIGIENGYVIGDDLSLLDRYHELGARYMTLVHNGHNDIADSAQPRPGLGDADAEHDGVSAFGERVIERMNDLGMLVDISHGSKQTALDAIELSRAPVVASHSSVKGLVGHARNMDDETLRALADNGGVVQIVAFDAYVRSQPAERGLEIAALRDRLDLTEPVRPDELPGALRTEFLQSVGEINNRYPPANLDDFIDHVDYAVDLIGIDHVGISSDFGGGGGVIGWAGAHETGNVTAELLTRGYTAEDIGKLWSGNLLRVWREAERVAAQ